MYFFSNSPGCQLCSRLGSEELTSQMSLDEGGLFISLISNHRHSQLYSLYLKAEKKVVS